MKVSIKVHFESSEIVEMELRKFKRQNLLEEEKKKACPNDEKMIGEMSWINLKVKFAMEETEDHMEYYVSSNQDS